jgi:transposase
VLGIGRATRIYLAPGATDMRKGYEGLYGLVRDRLQCEPLSGHVFLFANARRNRLKLIYWDGTGLWVCGKRLQRGCFGWPEANPGEMKVTLTPEEFAMLIGGMDVQTAKRRDWYRREIDEVIAPRINPA